MSKVILRYCGLSAFFLRHDKPLMPIRPGDYRCYRDSRSAILAGDRKIRRDSEMFFDITLRFCDTEVSLQEADYVKEAHRARKAYRQEGLGQTQEVHDLHASYLQEGEQTVTQQRPSVRAPAVRIKSY